MKRRTFIGMAGGALAVTACGPKRFLSEWRGVLFGSEVGITVAGLSGREDPDWSGYEKEMRRLEGILSLHDPASELAQLNRDGTLESPSRELVDLARRALILANWSRGAFDPTIQPYWTWLQGRLQAGQEPAEAECREQLARVDFRKLRVEDDGIWFEAPGMGLTLNAMAQGYVTDRVTELLVADGVTDFLVNLGEFAARGRDGKGEPWRIPVRAGGADGKVIAEVVLEDEALAVSSGAGHRMSATGKWTHLLSPENGTSPEAARTVAVTAPEAVIADGLATACGLMAEAAGRKLVARYPGAKLVVI